jgi:hypothetical protein
MPLEEMRQYKPALYREDDFDSFWESTLRAAMHQPINAKDLKADGLQGGISGRRRAGSFRACACIMAIAGAGRDCST